MDRIRLDIWAAGVVTLTFSFFPPGGAEQLYTGVMRFQVWPMWKNYVKFISFGLH